MQEYKRSTRFKNETNDDLGKSIAADYLRRSRNAISSRSNTAPSFDENGLVEPLEYSIPSTSHNRHVARPPSRPSPPQPQKDLKETLSVHGQNAEVVCRIQPSPMRSAPRSQSTPPSNGTTSPKTPPPSVRMSASSFLSGITRSQQTKLSPGQSRSNRSSTNEYAEVENGRPPPAGGPSSRETLHPVAKDVKTRLQRSNSDSSRGSPVMRRTEAPAPDVRKSFGGGGEGEGEGGMTLGKSVMNSEDVAGRNNVRQPRYERGHSSRDRTPLMSSDDEVDAFFVKLKVISEKRLSAFRRRVHQGMPPHFLAGREQRTRPTAVQQINRR